MIFDQEKAAESAGFPSGDILSKSADDLTSQHVEVAEEAVGGDVNNLPPGYYRSFHFIGTILAAWLQYLAVYAGYTVPISVLSVINDDIGPDPNYTWISIVVNSITSLLLYTY